MSCNRKYPCSENNNNYLYKPREYQHQHCRKYQHQQYPGQLVMGRYDLYDTDGNSINYDAVPTMATQADPPPLISNNPVVTNFTLFKQLTAYPNYGNPSRNADILYTGNTGTWSFELQPFLFVPGRQRVQITIRAVLDDHSNVPENSYSARITINGNVVHNGRVPLQHGFPAGGIFTNWRDLTFNIDNQRRITRITIENTSSAGPNDWIGLDWMEIRLSIR